MRILEMVAAKGSCSHSDLSPLVESGKLHKDDLERFLGLLGKARLIERDGASIEITARGRGAVSQFVRKNVDVKDRGILGSRQGRAAEQRSPQIQPPPNGENKQSLRKDPASPSDSFSAQGSVFSSGGQKVSAGEAAVDPIPARSGETAGYRPPPQDDASQPIHDSTETAREDSHGRFSARTHPGADPAHTSRRKIVGLAIAAIVLVLAFAWLYSASDTANGGTEYRFASVQRADLNVFTVVTGRLKAIDTVDVSSQLSGQVVRLDADFNDKVAAGAPLAQLDDKTFKLAVAEAQATLTKATASYHSAQARTEGAKARLDQAKQDYDRKAILAKKGNVSTQDVDDAQAKLLSAQSALDAAQADEAVQKATIDVAAVSLKKAKVDLDRTTIRAPINGTVIGRSVELGQTVSVSMEAPTLFTIAHDLTEMRVDARVDEADIGRIEVGQVARFSVDAYPDRNFVGKVIEIHRSPETVQNVVTYTVVITADNPDSLLLPGMTALVRIVTTARPHALLVPNAALRFAPSPSARPETTSSGVPATEAGPAGHVWVQEKSGALSRVTVSTGATDGNVTEIVAGKLTRGEKVAIGKTPPKTGKTLFGFRLGI